MKGKKAMNSTIHIKRLAVLITVVAAAAILFFWSDSRDSERVNYLTKPDAGSQPLNRADQRNYSLPENAPLPAQKLQKLIAASRTAESETRHTQLLERADKLSSALKELQALAGPQGVDLAPSSTSPPPDDMPPELVATQQRLQAIKNHIDGLNP